MRELIFATVVVFPTPVGPTIIITFGADFFSSKAIGIFSPIQSATQV